jgi:hypothetical protein
MHRSCFYRCSNLSEVTFGSGSTLRELPTSAFADCDKLRGLIIPSSVEIIGNACFWSCKVLASVTFESPSNLRRIEERAFSDCTGLRSLALPSSVAFVGNLCFEGCRYLTNLTISSPSQLVELRSLPPELAGSIDVPDSVEVLHWLKHTHPRRDSDLWTILNFGSESKLETITVTWKTPKSLTRRSARAFERLSNPTLKRLRSNLEISGGDGGFCIGYSPSDLVRLPANESDVSDE